MTSRVSFGELKRPGPMARMSRRRRVAVLAHPHCLPPDDYAALPYAEQLEYRTEANVLEALENLGHRVRVVPLEDEVLPLRKTVQEMRPHVAFNLIEEFHGAAVYDHNVVSYLELLRIPYARLDFRLDTAGRPFFIEANPNPDIARDAEFAHSAEAAGYSYDELIQRVVALGLSSIEG